MMHLDTELRYINPHIGYGVFATRPIPRGTITWVLDDLDQILRPAWLATRPAAQREVVERYSYIDARGRYVLCWDIGRYVNHSCTPTSRGVGPYFEIAVRDIEAGEELTNDYAELNLIERFSCGCSSAECRGIVRADDLLRHGRDWDQLVAAAFACVAGVPQPLAPCVGDREGVADLIRGERPLPSCLEYRVLPEVA